MRSRTMSHHLTDLPVLPGRPEFLFLRDGTTAWGAMIPFAVSGLVGVGRGAPSYFSPPVRAHRSRVPRACVSTTPTSLLILQYVRRSSTLMATGHSHLGTRPDAPRRSRGALLPLALPRAFFCSSSSECLALCPLLRAPEVPGGAPPRIGLAPSGRTSAIDPEAVGSDMATLLLVPPFRRVLRNVGSPLPSQGRPCSPRPGQATGRPSCRTSVGGGDGRCWSEPRRLSPRGVRRCAKKQPRHGLPCTITVTA